VVFTPDLSHHVALVPAAQVRDRSWTQGALGLWRTADHTLLKQIPITKREAVYTPALSPDMRWLCVIYGGTKMEIWDLQQERLLKTLESRLRSLADFYPADGTLIAVLDGALVRIHLPEARIEPITTGLTSINHLSVSPDGTLAGFSQSRDLDGVTPLLRLEVRSLVDGSRLYTAPTRLWGDLAWTPDSSSLVAFDYDHFNLSLHHLRPGGQPPRELLRRLSTGRRAAIWPDGRVLGWADNGGFLHLHDLWLNQEMLRLPDRAMTLAVSADGSRFAYSPDSARAAISELQPAPILQQWKPTNRRTVDRELALSPDGRWIATWDLHGLTLWRAQDMQPVAERETSQFENIHFSADSRQLRFNGGTTRHTIWDIREAADGQVTLQPPGMKDDKSAHRLISASLSGHWEATTQPDEKATHYFLWKDGKIVTQVKRDANPHPVDWHSRLISPDGRWAAFGCMAVESAPIPGFTYIIHFDGDNHRTLLSEQASHTHLAISPDSRWLVGGEGTDYAIWDSSTWKKVHQVPEHLADSVPGSAAFSPDGSLLALEVEHGRIRLLRPGTWQEVLTITPPQDLPLVRMAFSPDGRHLYTTGGQILHRWDVAKLQAELNELGIGW
jgi:WD40 repeat protein